MMKDFDEHIRNEGGAFKLQPRQEVWTRIETELNAKKEKKRILWYWWLLPLMLAGGWAGHALFQGKNEMTPQQMDKANHEEKTIHTTPEAVLENPSKQPNIALQPKSTEPAALPEGGAALRTPLLSTAKKHSPINALEGQLIGLPQKTDEAEEVKTKNETFSQGEMALAVKDTAGMASPASTEAATPKNEYAFPEHAASLPSSERMDTMEQLGAVSMGIPADSGVVSETKNEKKSKPGKQHPWRIVAGAGMHNYGAQSGANPFSSNRLQSSEPIFNPTNPGSNFAAISSPQAGAGFIAGIERSLTIPGHPRWEWQTGIHYQYQTVKITTGTRRDSSISFDNFNGGLSSNRSSYYYVPGSSIEHTGAQHRMHLQAGVGWFMHSNQKWILQGMFYGGMVMHADYLVPHSSQTGFVPVDQVLRKGYYGLETGIRFQPGHWGLGIYGQTNLSSSISNPALKNQYWRGAELRINYQLTTKK